MTKLPVQTVATNPSSPRITQACPHMLPSVAVITPNTTVDSDAGMNQVIASPAVCLITTICASVSLARPARSPWYIRITPPPTQHTADATCRNLKIEYQSTCPSADDQYAAD